MSGVIRGARYVHTNLVARDWRALADFYIATFGCVFVPPERAYEGDALERGTGLPRATLAGVHLRLPGHGDAGPTLEIFSYGELAGDPAAAVNRRGYGHLAFEVASVPEARAAVIAAGGAAVGEVVMLTTRVGSKITWCYVTDPEDNILELQSWS